MLLHNKLDYFLRFHICWAYIGIISNRGGIYAMHTQHIYRVLGMEKDTLLKMEITNKMEQPIKGVTNKWSKPKTKESIYFCLVLNAYRFHTTLS